MQEEFQRPAPSKNHFFLSWRPSLGGKSGRERSILNHSLRLNHLREAVAVKGYSLVFVGLFAASIHADTSIRCGKWVLESGVGTSNYMVLKKCGEPTFRDSDRWVYDKGSRKSIKILYFHGGKLDFIREENRN